jgi:hypothetical protein
VLQPQGLSVVAELRGAAGLLTTVKSVEFLFVSLQLALRRADLVALRAEVAEVSEQLAAP